MLYLSIASLIYAILHSLYQLYQYLHRPVSFTIDPEGSMPSQVGKTTTYKITPRDASGNPLTAFATGTPPPTWPGLPPATDATTVVSPTDGMSVTDTPITVNPETLTASVVINGTAVQRSTSFTPAAGDAIDFTIDEVVSP